MLKPVTKLKFYFINTGILTLLALIVGVAAIILGVFMGMRMGGLKAAWFW